MALGANPTASSALSKGGLVKPALREIGEMSGFRAPAFRVFSVAAFALCAGLAQAQSPPLQQVADEAALAAVQVLGAGGSPDQVVAVAQEKVAAFGLSAQVEPSPGEAKVTVRIAPPKSKKEVIVGAARYIAPEQAPQWAWAGRQRFAVKPAPVVVGSRCLLNCDPLQ